MKDPYAVLGIDRLAGAEALKAKYLELRAVYGEQRFKAGEEGNEGARKLQELEEAWVIISADIEKENMATAFGGDYGQIDGLIRQGKYNEAQDLLDSISDRNGEWHYMQAIVFYKREWLTEAKTQLEIAVREDPSNQKYRSSLDKLKMAMSNPQTAQSANGQGMQGQMPPQYDQAQPPQQAENMSNCLSSCCCAYCLTDCLCNSMRFCC